MAKRIDNDRTRWTYAEYARLPNDGNRYEVVDGEVLVTPAPGPPHQEVAANLFERLRAYVRRHDLGKVYWDVDLLFAPGQLLRPDMVYVPTAALDGVTDPGVESVPGLVVEVLSPSSANIDRVRKPPRYRDYGVPEYWVVDRDARAVERYRLEAGRAPDAEMHTSTLRWRPAPAIPALDLRLGKLFPND